MRFTVKSLLYVMTLVAAYTVMVSQSMQQHTIPVFVAWAFFAVVLYWGLRRI